MLRRELLQQRVAQAAGVVGDLADVAVGKRGSVAARSNPHVRDGRHGPAGICRSKCASSGGLEIVGLKSTGKLNGVGNGGRGPNFNA